MSDEKKFLEMLSNNLLQDITLRADRTMKKVQTDNDLRQQIEMILENDDPEWLGKEYGKYLNEGNEAMLDKVATALFIAMGNRGYFNR